MFFRFLSIVLLISTIYCFESNTNSENDGSDYIIFLRQQPIVDCLGNGCTIPNWYRQFAVHVLEPRNDTYVPTFCDSNYPFDLQEIESLVDTLTLEFPDFWNFNQPEGFWKTSWEKHGTCAEKILGSEYNYFETAILLKDLYDVERIFIDAKIFPSNTTTFAYSTFDDAVTKAIGKKPSILCKVWDNKPVLQEIQFCFDQQLQLIDCSEPIRVHERDGCGDLSSIYFIANYKQSQAQ
ncbi:ribonuclease t2 [Anaeramoeba flamelloides]|uniref:Ribonuclease t2 n=1 Tax=Anaeramoeba flamelloides TaxID=1746091 RepID=A0AAV8AKC3_9EUKA|nr:ribonuclease t2 [Anaeramoeba flamelloides]